MSNLLRGIRRPGRGAPSLAAVCSALVVPFALAACGGDAADDAEVEGAGPDQEVTGETAADSVRRGPNLIEISLVDDTVPTVDMDSACGRKGNSVLWAFVGDTAGIRNWVVKFTNGSPFTQPGDTIQSRRNVMTPHGGAIAANLATDSKFPYVVQVTRNDTTWGSDPEIVIKDVSLVSPDNCEESPDTIPSP